MRVKMRRLKIFSISLRYVFFFLFYSQSEDNEKEINRLSTFPFPPCINSMNRRFNTEWVFVDLYWKERLDYFIFSFIFHHVTINFPFFSKVWLGLMGQRWERQHPRCGVRWLRHVLFAANASSCLLNKWKWGNHFFFFCPDNFLFLMLCNVNLISWSGLPAVFQASRVSRPCGILATRCTLTSSPPTWSTCLRCPCTNLLPRPPGDPSELWPLSQPNPPTITQNLKKSVGAYKFVK